MKYEIERPDGCHAIAEGHEEPVPDHPGAPNQGVAMIICGDRRFNLTTASARDVDPSYTQTKEQHELTAKLSRILVGYCVGCPGNDNNIQGPW